MTVVATPQPQPRPTIPQQQQLVTTVNSAGSEDHDEHEPSTIGGGGVGGGSGMGGGALRQYSTPVLPRSNNSILLATTPIEEAVKLDGPEFEQIMKERARIRREKEDSHVAELRVKVQRLEQALAAETKRRVEATRNLERQAKEEIKHWEDRCLKEMKQQREMVEDRLEKLELRFNELEQRYQQETEQQQTTLTQKGDEFVSALDELRKEAETERKLRLAREGQLLQQIETHGKDYENLWDRERQERIESVGELVHQLESNEEIRKQSRKAVEIRLEEELTQLQQELQQETLERQKRDDEIASALDKYTFQFQQSLNILNSDEFYDP